VAYHFLVNSERSHKLNHKGTKHMHKLVIALVIAVVAAGPAVASEEADVMAVVNQAVDGFNKGDIKMLTSACADEVSIIDEFSPYEWQGAGACAKWSSDYDNDAKTKGITEGRVTLGKPSHIDVVGDRAYVVGSANYSYKEKGKPVKEVGSIFTVVLQKGTDGWRIKAWAWSKH
jgi:ketosteroid isomerase-like protein